MSCSSVIGYLKSCIPAIQLAAIVQDDTRNHKFFLLILFLLIMRDPR